MTPYEFGMKMAAAPNAIDGPKPAVSPRTAPVVTKGMDGGTYSRTGDGTGTFHSPGAPKTPVSNSALKAIFSRTRRPTGPRYGE